jgi:peptidoglycan/xylan/chitin deacetylase (PgdA/CDA1 family)
MGRRGLRLAAGLALAQLVLAAGVTAPVARPALSQASMTSTLSSTSDPVPVTTPTIIPAASVPVGRQVVHIPILMYHYIRTNPNPSDRVGFGLSVEPKDFQAQMDWLSTNGYHPVDVSDLRAYFAGQADLPAKPVVITFDDGNADLFTAAFPVLRGHHFKGVAYIVSGFLDAKDRVTHDQVLEMDRNGIEIASHTVSHVDLTTLSPSRLEHELAASKQELEGLLGHSVPDFAYPAGRHNRAVEGAVAQAGYETAVTTDPGTTHDWNSRLTWLRIRVAGGEPLEAFIASLGPTESTVPVPQVVWPSPEPTPTDFAP